MRRTVLAVLAGVSLLAGSALADSPPGQGGTGQFNPSGQQDRLGGQDTGQFGQDTGQAGQFKGDISQRKGVGSIDEPKKYLSVVDLHLENAMNNVKVLYESTQMKRLSLREWIPMLPWPLCPLAGHAIFGQNVVVGSMRVSSE